ncbi:MAG: 50S ribosomal protein L25 [Patescibacteria group bacterium]
MTNFSIKAQARELIGKKVKSLRIKGLIPAVLFGHNIKNQNLTVKRNEFLKVYGQSGESNLVDLQIDEKKPVKILVHDLQRDPENDEIIHADFYQISEDEKLKTRVKLEFVGEAPAVKELGGVLVKNLDEIEIECLPKDLELLGELKVDLSSLKTLNSAVHIKDLEVPNQIKILASPDEVVALVAEVKEEAVVEAKPIAEIEVVKKEKEGEEAKEGAVGEKSDAKGGSNEKK